MQLFGLELYFGTLFLLEGMTDRQIMDIQIRYLSGAAMARGYEAVYDQLSASGKAGT